MLYWRGSSGGHTGIVLRDGFLLRSLLDGGLFCEGRERPFLTLRLGGFGAAGGNFLELKDSEVRRKVKDLAVRREGVGVGARVEVIGGPAGEGGGEVVRHVGGM